MNLFNEVTRGAFFGNNRTHRYWLMRSWDSTKPMVAFIGLNPSTANENQNDNTITKVMKIAAHNGYGGLYMLNLFSCVTSDPKKVNDHNMPTNDLAIMDYTDSSKVKDVVFCWGNFKEADYRAKEVIEWFENPLCIAQNKNGSPKHPLYCKDNSILIPFKK